MPVCSNGHEVVPGLRSCPMCGVLMGVRCPNGHLTAGGDRYCSSCGADLFADSDATVESGMAVPAPTDPTWAAAPTGVQAQAEPPPPAPTDPTWAPYGPPPPPPSPSWPPPVPSWPPPSPPPPPPPPFPPASTSNRRVVVLVVLAGLVVLVGLGVIVTTLRHRGSSTTATTAPAATAAPTPVATAPPPAATTAPTTSPSTTVPSTTTVPAALLVDTSAVSADPLAPAIAATFQAYFGGIDARDFRSAYAVLSPANRGRLSFANFTNGSATSTDSGVSIQSLSSSGDGSVSAAVGFTSHQAAANGPRPGETCTVWSLAYRMVPAPAGSPADYLIDSARPIGSGSQPC